LFELSKLDFEASHLTPMPPKLLKGLLHLLRDLGIRGFGRGPEIRFIPLPNNLGLAHLFIEQDLSVHNQIVEFD
jgi:hypothetical protein